MSYTTTKQINLRKPSINNDWGEWGYNLNKNFDILDEVISKIKSKRIDFTSPVLAKDITPVVGLSKILYPSVILNNIPATYIVGSCQLVFDIVSGLFNSELKISGKTINRFSQNETLNDEETIVVDEVGMYRTSKFFSGPVVISSEESMTCNIMSVTGAHFQLPHTVLNIDFCGQSNMLANPKLSVKLYRVVLAGHKISLEEISNKLKIDETGLGGNLVWQKSLAVEQDVEPGKIELIIYIEIPIGDVSFWTDVHTTIFLRG